MGNEGTEQKPEGQTPPVEDPNAQKPAAEPKQDPPKPTEEGGKPKGDQTPPKKADETVVLGKPKGETKEGGAAPAAEKPPENYEIKLPEHSHLSQQDLERTVADARKRGLSNDKAQELLNERSSAVAAYVDSANAGMAQWLEMSKQDKEIGGENFEKSVHLGNQALTRFASNELQELLHTTKLGNHPEVIRLFAKIGKAMEEDTFVPAPAGGQPGKGQKTTMAKRMFPKT